MSSFWWICADREAELHMLSESNMENWRDSGLIGGCGGRPHSCVFTWGMVLGLCQLSEINNISSPCQDWCSGAGAAGFQHVSNHCQSPSAHPGMSSGNQENWMVGILLSITVPHCPSLSDSQTAKTFISSSVGNINVCVAHQSPDGAKAPGEHVLFKCDINKCSCAASHDSVHVWITTNPNQDPQWKSTGTYTESVQ